MSASPSLSPSPETISAVVARLRTAGCVFAEDEARLLFAAAATPTDLDAMVERRVAGTPLEYILGWVEFAGRRIAVDPGVFVPRRRSEFLAEQALSRVRSRTDPVVVDLCCGCGALGLTLAAALAGTGRAVQLYAADVDPAAVRCAGRNIDSVAAVDGIAGRVYLGDLFAPLPDELRGRVDVLVANAPYVPTEAILLMPPEAREHEPQVALDGGSDGLDLLRRIAAGAPEWLAPGGHVLVESSRAQASRVAAAFAGHGLRSDVLSSEERGATVVVGSR